MSAYALAFVAATVLLCSQPMGMAAASAEAGALPQASIDAVLCSASNATGCKSYAIMYHQQLQRKQQRKQQQGSQTSRRLLQAQELTQQAATTSAVAAAAGAGPGCRRLLWFTALYTKDLDEDYLSHLKVAIMSARQHAPSLVPYVVADGGPSPLTSWLEQAAGVTVLYHELSVIGLLERAVVEGHVEKFVTNLRGTFLRLDVPLLFNQVLAQKHAGDGSIDQRHFLYTDVDVVFLRDVNTCALGIADADTTVGPDNTGGQGLLPRGVPFAMGPEMFRGSRQPMLNAGVMMADADAMLGQRQAMIDFAQSRNWRFTSNDQGLLNEFAAATAQDIPLLPDTFNWKGYWGAYEDPQGPFIFHMHGPKPNRCLECYVPKRHNFQEGQCGCPEVYDMLFRWAVQADGGETYTHALAMYEALLAQAAALLPPPQQQQQQQQLQPSSGADAGMAAAASVPGEPGKVAVAAAVVAEEVTEEAGKGVSYAETHQQQGTVVEQLPQPQQQQALLPAEQVLQQQMPRTATVMVGRRLMPRATTARLVRLTDPNVAEKKQPVWANWENIV